MKLLKYSEFTNEAVERPHQIKSEAYWRKVLQGNDYALRVLDSIMSTGKGFATTAQMNILRRAEKGDKTPYNKKN